MFLTTFKSYVSTTTGLAPVKNATMLIRTWSSAIRSKSDSNTLAPRWARVRFFCLPESKPPSSSCMLGDTSHAMTRCR